MDVNDNDGVFYNEQLVQTFLEIKNNTNEIISIQIEWSILTDDWRPLKNVIIPSRLEGK